MVVDRRVLEAPEMFLEGESLSPSAAKVTSGSTIIDLISRRCRKLSGSEPCKEVVNMKTLAIDQVCKAD